MLAAAEGEQDGNDKSATICPLLFVGSVLKVIYNPFTQQRPIKRLKQPFSETTRNILCGQGYSPPKHNFVAHQEVANSATNFNFGPCFGG